MKKIWLASMFFASTALAQKSDKAIKFAAHITEKGLREKLTILASDEMEGRETATEGQKKAAAFIEAHFKKQGLLPGNGSSFQQVYKVYQDELLNHQLVLNGETLFADKDYSFNLSNIASTKLNLNSLVFAGYGLNNDKQNDFKNLDVKGKLVVVLDGLPSDAQTPTTQTGTRVLGLGTNASKANTAKSLGAIGLIIISSDFPKKSPLSVKGNMTVNKPTDNNFFTITVNEKVGATLLGRTFLPTKKQFEEINKGNYFSELTLNIQKSTNTLESSNVIGIVEGTDKKDEYIFITGHYDHLGKRGDVIYYGADDDGSGTTAVMQLAEAFAKAKAKGEGPRRTLVFMAVSGEEKGLWGSKYYTDNPTFPLAKTSVDLNIDMIGRIDPSYKGDSMNYVFAIGEDKLSTELLPITDSINKWYAKMEIDRRYNDPKDPNRFYFRSDHYNFAAKGVPIIFYFNGVHKDYHKATDTVDKINFDLMLKRSLLVYYTAWEMANRSEMLKRDLPLSAVPTR
ncbi:MAG: M28 family peptidase [Chitinophagaceae bacterium]